MDDAGVMVATHRRHVTPFFDRLAVPCAARIEPSEWPELWWTMFERSDASSEVRNGFGAWSRAWIALRLRK
jgi:hypothetical protein